MIKQKENGRSMVEMLGLLAIIGVLSAGALAGYSKAMFRHKVNQTVDIFNSVLQHVMELDEKDIGDGSLIYGAEEAMKYGFFPDCQKTPDDSCQLPVGTLYIGLEKYESIHGELEITFHDSKSCISILSVGWEKAMPIEWFNGAEGWGGGWIFVDKSASGGGQIIYNPYNSYQGEIITEVTLEKITEACQICDENESCVVGFAIRSYL